MSRVAAACVFALLAVGCRPRGPAFAQPPPNRGPLQTQQDPPPPPPPHDPPPPDPSAECIVEFTFPATAPVGQYPSFGIRAQPPIPYHGQGPEPMAVVVIVAPDGSRDELSIPLVNQPVCAYCLPAKGSGGCDHDCRWDPFSETVESVHLKIVGPHRVSVRLQDSACAIAGAPARIQGVPSSRRPPS